MAEHAVRPVRLLQLGDRILAQGYPSDASMLASTCLRDSPRSLGPGPVGKYSLVART